MPDTEDIVLTVQLKIIEVRPSKPNLGREGGHGGKPSDTCFEALPYLGPVAKVLRGWA